MATGCKALALRLAPHSLCGTWGTSSSASDGCSAQFVKLELLMHIYKYMFLYIYIDFIYYTILYYIYLYTYTVTIVQYADS